MGGHNFLSGILWIAGILPVESITAPANMTALPAPYKIKTAICQWQFSQTNLS